MRLQNKIGIVSAAASGMGRAGALRFAREGAAVGVGGGGALLYTASTSGIQGSAFSPVYSMAKFGIVGFVRSLAKRLAPEKIRANAICPGPIDTPMLRVFVARPDQQRTSGMDKEQLVVQRGQQNPMRRTGKPEEIANAALFLLSDEASFVSRAPLPVDGAATA